MTTDVAARSRKALEPSERRNPARSISSNAKAAAELSGRPQRRGARHRLRRRQVHPRLTKLYGEVFGIDPKEKAIDTGQGRSSRGRQSGAIPAGDARSLQFAGRTLRYGRDLQQPASHPRAGIKAWRKPRAC